jgi:hypothetical protein
MRHNESKSQQALITWWAYTWRQYKLPCEALLFAIPNGGARRIVEAVIMKREGVRKGIPDLFLAVPRGRYHGLFIEMKTTLGRLSPEQKCVGSFLSDGGYCWIVARSTQDAMTIIDRYLTSK